MHAGYLAFIPARGGSKSIPLKNIKPMAGRPLIHWAVQAADECRPISRVVVSTDSPDIEQAVLEFGSSKVVVHHRSEHSASDTASTEQVMLEYARTHPDFDAMILIQATSPLLTAEDIERGIQLYESGRFDSVLSVVRQKRFIWEESDGIGRPVNYDYRDRPRRQEFDGFLVENGAFYIISRDALLRSECRLHGRIGLVEMDEASYFEIDEPSDWPIVEGELTKRLQSGDHQAQERDLSRIKALFSDCDGVMTDGGMYYTETGDEFKKFQTRDGVGFAMLRRAGLVVGIITSESVALVRRRAEKLDLDELHMGASDKMRVISELCEKYGLAHDEIAYIGDDVGDVPVIASVGFGCSVRDGMREARDAAEFVTNARGGEGAVREVAELILAARAS